MHLFVIRHGETQHNVDKICQGQLDIPLNENGFEQARKLGLRFKNTKIDMIYSSDLVRASQTAKAIHKMHPNASLTLDKRLRERNFGAQQGVSHKESSFNWDNLPPDVETDSQVYGRVKEFFDELLSQHMHKTIIIVCHGGSKRALLCLLHNLPFTKMGSWEKMDNTAVSEFEVREDNNHRMHTLNCTKHLQ